MNAELTRWGRCKEITLKGEQCLNPATGPHGRCFVPKHKAQIGTGKGVQYQLPTPVRDSGAPMDTNTPLPSVSGIQSTVAYIKAKLNTTTH